MSFKQTAAGVTLAALAVIGNTVRAQSVDPAAEAANARLDVAVTGACHIAESRGWTSLNLTSNKFSPAPGVSNDGTVAVVDRKLACDKAADGSLQPRLTDITTVSKAGQTLTMQTTSTELDTLSPERKMLLAPVIDSSVYQPRP